MMQRLLPPRPPAYTPHSDVAAEDAGKAFDRWGQRFLLLVGLLGALGASASYAGWRIFGPSTQGAEARTIAEAARDSAHVNAKRLDVIEHDVQTNLYIGCQLLKVQQPNAIPLQECSDAQTRRDGR
jgi:hypothetical protein